MPGCTTCTCTLYIQVNFSGVIANGVKKSSRYAEENTEYSKRAAQTYGRRAACTLIKKKMSMMVTPTTKDSVSPPRPYPANQTANHFATSIDTGKTIIHWVTFSNYNMKSITLLHQDYHHLTLLMLLQPTARSQSQAKRGPFL